MHDAWLTTNLQPAATRLIPLAIWLILIWLAESYFSLPNKSRVRHGLVNLSIVGVNGLLLFFTLGYLSFWVCSHAPPWTQWISGQWLASWVWTCLATCGTGLITHFHFFGVFMPSITRIAPWM